MNEQEVEALASVFMAMGEMQEVRVARYDAEIMDLKRTVSGWKLQAENATKNATGWAKENQLLRAEINRLNARLEEFSIHSEPHSTDELDDNDFDEAFPPNPHYSE